MSHIMIWRGSLPEDGLTGFWHHGIRCADGSVVHYSGMDGMKTLHNAAIQRTELSVFTSGNTDRTVHTVQYGDRDGAASAAEVERRALSAVGTRGYHLLASNCETFARWCVLGRGARSAQAVGAWLGVGAGVATLATGGGLLGAALTALVAQRVWDTARNPSASRRGVQVTLDEIDSDDD